MIQTFLDESKLPFRTLEQKVFDAAVDYVFRNFPKWGREVNATLAALNALAAGGVYAFPYVFDSSTVDSDPGVGKLRLSSTTQTGAAALRMDVQILGGVDISNVFADLRAATSSVKGSVRLVKMTDPSKWAIFDVTAVALPVGYRNLSVVARASSSVNPFANGDPLIVFIDRNGDSGTAPGATELLAESNYAGNPATAATFPTVFTPDYEWYMIDIPSLEFSSTTIVRFQYYTDGILNNANSYLDTQAGGGAIGTPATMGRISGSASRISGLLQIRGVNTNWTKNYQFDGNGWGSGQMSPQAWRCSFESGGQVSGFSIHQTSGTVISGRVRVYGVKKA